MLDYDTAIIYDGSRIKTSKESHNNSMPMPLLDPSQLFSDSPETSYKTRFQFHCIHKQFHKLEILVVVGEYLSL